MPTATTYTESDGLMTVDEAARYLRLGRSMIYKLMEQEQLPFVRIGRLRRLPRKAVQDLAEKGSTT